MTRWSLLGDGFAGLWRWLRRRPVGAGEFAYHGRSQLIAFLVRHRSPVRTLHVAADDPVALEAAVRSRVGATAASGESTR
jgi:hypothetical protein